MSILDDFDSIIRVINSYFPSELFKVRLTGDSQINIFVENIDLSTIFQVDSRSQ